MTLDSPNSRGVHAATIFCSLASGTAVLALLALVAWANADVRALRLVGITNWWHALLLVVVPAIVAWSMARLVFNPIPPDVASGGLRGALVAVVAFIATVLTHGAILSFARDPLTAVAAVGATAFFGGLAFALPSVILAGAVGGILSYRASADRKV